jgi:hypothetical protein
VDGLRTRPDLPRGDHDFSLNLPSSMAQVSHPSAKRTPAIGSTARGRPFEPLIFDSELAGQPAAAALDDCSPLDTGHRCCRAAA